MTPGEAPTLLSVRGEARRTVAPDQANMSATLTKIADTKPAATAAAASKAAEVLADLAALGARALAVDTTRHAVTWSLQSIRTQEEYAHKRSGEHGPTGRHLASGHLLVGVRDFTLLDRVSEVLTGHDDLDLHWVNWAVDDDNREWALVRADAIQAALLKGRDYAAALGGAVLRVEHVADVGLLNGETPGGGPRMARAVGLSYDDAEGGGISLDPVPQVLSAIIDARLTASIGPLPGS